MKKLDGDKSFAVDLKTTVDNAPPGCQPKWVNDASATGLPMPGIGTSRETVTGELLSPSGDLKMARRLSVLVPSRSSGSFRACKTFPIYILNPSTTSPFPAKRAEATSRALKRSSTAGSNQEGASRILERIANPLLREITACPTLKTIILSKIRRSQRRRSLQISFPRPWTRPVDGFTLCLFSRHICSRQLRGKISLSAASSLQSEWKYRPVLCCLLTHLVSEMARK